MSRKQTNKYFRKRRAGVLLHPTSLPSADTDGALGDSASLFMNFLADAGFSIWQMLPVNAPDEYGSPYQSSSIYAGDPQLISLQRLFACHWMQGARPEQHEDPFAYAHKCFKQHATDAEQSDYQSFKREHAYWLEDYVLYSTIKQFYDDKPWWDWPESLRHRDTTTLDSFRKNNSPTLDYYFFEQYIFFSQWHALRKQAHDKGILLLGDMPLFAAHDSVAVWAHPDFFQLEHNSQPTFVAGVPPDYFSATGQRWGNPVYNWHNLAKDGFTWWIERLRTQLELFDMVRIDHFRGLVAHWQIPADCPTAENGEWINVSGRELCQAFKDEFGELPLIAEDLGSITPEVLALRDDFCLPGMKVLLFAFDSDTNNPYLPHNHDLQSVVYTGTHDNNTILGWFYNLDDAQQQRVYDTLRNSDDAMPWPLIYTALESICPIAILPMQDVLGLDGSHRMNTPGTVEGNWRWKFEWEWVSPDLVTKFRHLNGLYGRC